MEFLKITSSVTMSKPRPLITVMTACYNEEENVRPLAEAVRAVFAKLPQYEYRHLFIDNCSEDGTAKILREMAAEDPNIQVIVNVRNFGHIRSPAHALLQAEGDAVISLVADFQDPPEMIPQFLEKWEAGAPLVLGQKEQAEESKLFFFVRRVYYATLSRVSEVKLLQNITGFGLYDRRVLEVLRQIDDPYPYIRGLICEIGIDVTLIQYKQPARRRGFTKNNLYTLYDMGMLGLTTHSKAFIRAAAIGGFFLSFLCLLVAACYLVIKLLLWNEFAAGMAPVVIGLFLMGAVQLFFIGLIGEYVAAMMTLVRKWPLVVERERYNLSPKATFGLAQLDTKASSVGSQNPVVMLNTVASSNQKIMPTPDSNSHATCQ